MKKRIAITLALVLALSLLSGCGKSPDGLAQNAAGDFEKSYMMADTVAETMAVSGSYSRSGSGDLGAPAPAPEAGPVLPENRKWIITMNLSAETDNLDSALEAVNQQISALNGYVESQDISNSSASSSRRRSAYLCVRIPADQVDAFVQEVGSLTNVVSQSRNVQDITLSYTDTEGRIAALEAEKDRLMELMEQAESMSDLLEIEERLTEVRYQLDNYSSTKRLYDNQIDYATVSLYITEVQRYTPVEEMGFWNRITDGLGDSMVNLGNSLVNLAVWVIVNLPYLLIAGLVIWGVTAVTRRSIRKRKAKKAAEK